MGTVVVTFTTEAGEPIQNGALGLGNLDLGVSTGATIDGFYTFDGAPAGERLVLSGMAPGGVSVFSVVQVSKDESISVTLRAPTTTTTTTTTITPNGQDQDVALGEGTITIFGNTVFTDGTGASYMGDVNVIVATPESPEAQPPVVEIDANGLPMDGAPVEEVFEISLTGDQGQTLQFSVPLQVTTPDPAPTTSPDTAPMWSFDEEKGLWVEQGEATKDVDGNWTASLPHLTWWRRVNGQVRAMGGIRIVPTGALPQGATDYDVNWTCTDAASGDVVAGNSSGYACVQVLAGSECTVSVLGAVQTGITVNNGCVCNWSNQQCVEVVYDLGQPVCGNGFVDTDETCDDGNTVAGDGCDASCNVEAECGDRTLTAPETCDDGNTVAGDGCDASCQTEPGQRGGLYLWIEDNGQTSTAAHDVQLTCTDSSTGNVRGGVGQAGGCFSIPSGYQCDVKVDDLVQTGIDIDNGCICNYSNQQCEQVYFDVAVAAGCGNGRLEPGEECDDNNITAGDGCAADCKIETTPVFNSTCDSSSLGGHASDPNAACPCYTPEDLVCYAGDWVPDGVEAFPTWTTNLYGTAGDFNSSIHIQTTQGGFQGGTNNYGELTCWSTGWGASDSSAAGFNVKKNITVDEVNACRQALTTASGVLGYPEDVVNY